MIKHPISYLWRELVQTLAMALVIIAAMMIALRCATPYIAERLSNLKYWAEFQIQHPLEVEKLSLRWEGAHPVIYLSQARLLDDNHQQVWAQAEEIALVINPLDSLVNGKFHFGQLAIRGAHIDLGSLPSTTQGMGLDTLLHVLHSPLGEREKAWLQIFEEIPIQEWVLADSSFHVVDSKQNDWSFTGIQGVVRRKGDDIGLRVRAVLPDAINATLMMGADFTNFFTKPAGAVYCHGADIAMTRLAQWFPAIPMEQVPLGTMGFSLWGTFDDQTHLTDVKLQLEGHEVLFEKDATQPAAYFSAVEGGLWWMHAPDSTQWRLMGHEWKVRHLDETWPTSVFELEQVGDALTSRYHVRAQSIAIDMWAPFLLRAQWLPADVHRILAGLDPRGMIRYIDLIYQPDTQWMEIRGLGDQIAFSIPHSQARLEGLNFDLSADSASGMLAMEAPAGTYRLTPEDPHVMEAFRGDLYWFHDPTGWDIQGLAHRAHLAPGVGNLEAEYHLHLDPTGHPESIGVLGSLDALPLTTVAAIMPGKTQVPDLHAWFQQAFKNGVVEEVQWVYRHDFHPQHAPVIHADAKIYGVTLDYDAPWPRLIGLDGHISLDGPTLRIQTHHATLAPNIPITATAFVADLFRSEPVLIVDTHLESTLPVVPHALKGTSLEGPVGKTIDLLHAQGALDLGLTLQVPLYPGTPVSVRGLLSLKDAKANIDFWKPIPLEEISGEIRFSEKQLTATDLKARWKSEIVHATMHADFETESHAYLGLLARSTIHAPFLKSWLGLPVLPLQGQTAYEVDVHVPLHAAAYAGHVIVRSQMEGISVDLPAPLYKDASTRQNYQLDVHLESDDRVGLVMQYGPSVSLAQRFQKHGTQWQAAQGHIHFGQDAVAGFQEKFPLLIDGTLPQVRLADWIAAFQRLSHTDKSKSTVAEAVWDPRIDLHIDTLDAWGWVFPHTRVKIRRHRHDWITETEGPNLVGKVTIPGETWTNKSILSFQMAKVHVPAFPAAHAKSIDKMAVLPTVRFYSDQVHWAQHQLDQVTLHLIPQKSGYAIDRFQSEGKDFRTMIRGYWGLRDPQSPFHVEGTLYARDMGRILQEIQQPSAIQDASADLAFNVSGMAGPDHFRPESVLGDIHFHLENGRIIGVDPGFGRVLSLLNVANIQRRLRLDFSDVTKKGFAFDHMRGNIHLDKSWASSSDLQLRGPIANIDFDGQMHLAEKHDVQADMRVSPNVTGSMPVAAVIASGGNPAVGAAVWLFNRLSQNQLNDIVQYHYKITGTWDDPDITEVLVENSPPASLQKRKTP